MMKPWKISVICILLTVLCLFTCVGYAALSDTLSINGAAKASIPSGLFITSVTTKESSRIDTNRSSVTYLEYTTTVDSTIRKNANNTAGTVTYTVTVLNNTKLTYSYRGIFSYGRIDRGRVLKIGDRASVRINS